MLLTPFFRTADTEFMVRNPSGGHLLACVAPAISSTIANVLKSDRAGDAAVEVRVLLDVRIQDCYTLFRGPDVGRIFEIRSVC